MLRVAVLPATCGGGGCGWIGAKGIELNAAINLAGVQLAAGRPTDILIHEMAHNFDVYAGQTHYLDDHAHAWTRYLQYAIQAYDQSGRRLPGDFASPDDALANARSSFWDAYESNPAFQWTSCVRDRSCASLPLIPEETWAGRLHRWTELHGFAAVRAAMAHLRAGRPTNAGPKTPEQLEDLLWQALAAGADMGMACMADAWRWPLSSGARAALAAAPPNPSCDDADNDGFRPLDGDLYDFDPTRHPGVAEVASGRDDDSDGLIDNVVLSELSVGDFGDWLNPHPLTPPRRVTGSLSSGADNDYLRFDASSAPHWHLRLRSLGPQRTHLRLESASGDQLFTSARAGEESRLSVALGAASWRAHVHGTGGGAYSLDIVPDPPWTLDCCVASPATPSGQTYQLSGAADVSLPYPSPPDSVRFWLEGVGFVGESPYGPTPSFELPAGGLSAGARSYRFQLYAGGMPAAPISPPGAVSIVAPCSAGLDQSQLVRPAAAHSFAVTVNAAPGCPWSVIETIDWLTPVGPTSGVGPGQVGFLAEANANWDDRAGEIRLGDQALALVQDGRRRAPYVSGYGWGGFGNSFTYTFFFADPDGAADLGVVNVLINNFLDGRGACYLAFDSVSRWLFLVNDAGSALSGNSIDANTTLSNSQCSIHLASSSAQLSNGSLRLDLSVTLSPTAFGGGRVVYVAARDRRENNSGWHTMLVTKVRYASAPVPLAESVSPSSSHGNRQTFTTTYRGVSAGNAPAFLQVLINRDLNGDHACYVGYDRANNALYLVDDLSPALLGPIVPNSGTGVMENSQCRVHGGGTTFSASGATAVLTIDVELKPGWSGETLLLFGATQTSSGANSGWQALGTHRAP